MLLLLFTRDVIEKHTTYFENYTHCIPLPHYQTQQSQDLLQLLLDQPAEQVMIKVAAAPCMSTDFTCKLLTTHVRSSCFMSTTTTAGGQQPTASCMSTDFTWKLLMLKLFTHANNLNVKWN